MLPAGAAAGATYYRDCCRPLSAADLERAQAERLDELDDRSVGCVTFAALHRSSQPEQQTDPIKDRRYVLMIKQRVAEDKHGWWAFPKGHADEGETDEDCAIRETMEEAGVRVRLWPEIFAETGYSFIKRMHVDRWRLHPAYPDEASRPKLVHHKVVRYYLAEVDGAVDPMHLRIEREQDAEVEVAEWVLCAEAAERLAHEESKKVFRALLERYTSLES